MVWYDMVRYYYSPFFTHNDDETNPLHFRYGQARSREVSSYLGHTCGSGHDTWTASLGVILLM